MFQKPSVNLPTLKFFVIFHSYLVCISENLVIKVLNLGLI